MAKEREARYQTAAELVQDLNKIPGLRRTADLIGLGSTPPPPTPPASVFPQARQALKEYLETSRQLFRH